MSTTSPPSPGDDWCYSCNRSEPIPEAGAYLVCGECFHCFDTADDLMAAVRKMAAEIGVQAPASADEVYFCPLCAHDF